MQFISKITGLKASIMQNIRLQMKILISRLYFSTYLGNEWSYSYHPILGDRFTKAAELGRIGIVATISDDPRSIINPEFRDTYVMKVLIVYKGRVIRKGYYTSEVQYLNPTKPRSFQKAFDRVCNEALVLHRRVL